MSATPTTTGSNTNPDSAGLAAPAANGSAAAPAPSNKPSIADRLATATSGAVYDVMRDMGQPHCVLPQTFHPLLPDQKAAGRIYTVHGHKDVTLEIRETLLAWTAVLSKAPADSIVICQPHDATLAHMNELSAETMALRKIRGYIVDGGCRDAQAIRRTGFPVWCKYFTPVDIVGRWIADGFGEPIHIAGVAVHTGDYAFADHDGVIIIPAANVEEVVTKVEQLLTKENLVRKAIHSGMDPQEAFLKFGTF